MMTTAIKTLMQKREELLYEKSSLLEKSEVKVNMIVILNNDIAEIDKGIEVLSKYTEKES